MRRYAFVDVQNTESTAQQFCGFSVDWGKLYEYLCHDRWSCDKIFFYTGIEVGNDDLANEFESLSKLSGCIVRAKPVFIYKKKDKTVQLKCVKCGEENVSVVDMGYDRKANCDVELTMDILDVINTQPDAEIFVLTGDGDFEPLLRRAAGVLKRVHLVSSTKKIEIAGLTKARFSTKLKELLIDEKEKVFFSDINTWKYKIKKDIN